MLTALAVAMAVAGPPAPKQPADVMAEHVRLTQAQVQAVKEARGAWKWYGAAWAFTASTTSLNIIRGTGDEANPLFRGKPFVAIAANLVTAAGLWRLEVWTAEKGNHRKVGRWIFVLAQLLVGSYELTVAF